MKTQSSSPNQNHSIRQFHQLMECIDDIADIVIHHDHRKNIRKSDLINYMQRKFRDTQKPIEVRAA